MQRRRLFDFKNVVVVETKHKLNRREGTVQTVHLYLMKSYFFQVGLALSTDFDFGQFIFYLFD